MTITGILRPAATLALLLGVAACAERPGAAEPAPPRANAPEDAGAGLVLQVEHVGGFLMPEATATQLPLASVYADGRVVLPGPVPAIYPGPAWPNLQVRDIGRGGVQALVDRAMNAGVAETADLGTPGVADAPSTRITLVTADGTYVREAYALFDAPVDLPAGGGDSGITAEQHAARAELLDLVDALGDLAVGTTGEAPPDSYTPDAVAAVARPWTASDDDRPDPVPEPLVWPGPALPGEPLGHLPDITCVTATGPESSAVIEAARSANMLTPWLSPDGTRWVVTFRPLLPHESGCADLAG